MAAETFSSKGKSPVTRKYLLDHLVIYITQRTSCVQNKLTSSLFYKHYISINDEQAKNILNNKPIIKPTLFRQIRIYHEDITGDFKLDKYLENEPGQSQASTSLVDQGREKALKIIENYSKTIDLGPIINPNFPWLISCPDTVLRIGSNFIPVKIIISQSGRYLNLENMLSNIDIIKRVDKGYQLTKDSSIYQEIQIYIEIFGAPGGFVVFYNILENKIHRVSVTKDKVCISYLLTKGYNLYFNTILPTLIKKFNSFKQSEFNL